MSDLHEVVFRWPYTANEAIVTGTFDQWSCSVRMDESPSGFTATIHVPWEEKVLYKFIVDGRWTTIDQTPTESDRHGNINNVYYAPTKPKELDTPRHEPPAAQEPKITPVPTPAPVQAKKEQDRTPGTKPTDKITTGVPLKPEQPAKGGPVVAKELSPRVQEKVSPPVPKVTPPSVVPVNNTKPIDTPPKIKDVAAPGNIPAVLPTPANLKSPFVIVPVNDGNTVDKQPPAVELSKPTETPSTHALPVNSPRKGSTGTSSSNTLLVEKKEEERREPKPEEAKKPDGTTGRTDNGVVGPGQPEEQPAGHPPATPVKDRTPTLPATPVTPPKFSSPPTTPKKPYFSGSTSSTPTSSPSHTLSKKGSFKKKRESFIEKVKHIFTPEKEKKEHHHKEKSHD